MTRSDLSQRIETSLLALGVSRNAAMVVGVSGGADSVALLHLLRELNEAGWSLRLHVAHLNHQIRGAEADEDARFVTELAQTLRIPATIDSTDVPARAQADGVSIEQAGRQCRLQLLERVSLQTGAEWVALAHQADDQAETVLHRVVRGTGIRGLVGIRPARPIRPGSAIQLIRPMLGIRRSEIEQYLDERKLLHRDDSSNQTLGYTRNVIRREVLPLLRDRFNPQIRDALLRLGQQAADLESYLDDLADKSLPPLILESAQDGTGSASDGLTIDCEALDRKPRVIRSYILRQAIRRIGIPEGDVTYDHLTRLLALAGDRSGSKSLHLPGGLRVTRAYGRLRLFRAETEEGASLAAGTDGGAAAEKYPESASPLPTYDGERVSIEGVTLLPSKGLEFTTQRFESNGGLAGPTIRHKKTLEPGLYEEWLDADRIQPPLLARSRRDGDRFCPLGMQGMKKVSDFLIDQKVAADQRDQTMLLCDQAGPIWVVPLRIDERVRLSEQTRHVLRVSVRQIQAARDSAR